MKLKVAPAIPLAALLLCACSSNDAQADAGNANACGTNHDTVTAQQLLDGLVTAKCATCHYPGTTQALGGELALDSVDALKATVGKSSKYAGVKVTDANHSENSTIYLKVLGNNVKAPSGVELQLRMPKEPAPELSATEKKLLQDWICTGAK